MGALYKPGLEAVLSIPSGWRASVERAVSGGPPPSDDVKGDSRGSCFHLLLFRMISYTLVLAKNEERV